jgi:hypothetical protein
MSNVAKFIEIRQHIESLAEQIAVSAELKTIPESSKRLDEATKLLAELTAMADNDVQEVVIERLTGQLAGLGTKVETLIARKRVVKKQPTA